MSQSFEHAKSRLDNIKTIEPLLSALRTMSMGAWQMANRKIANLSRYEDHLNQILFTILPNVTRKPTRVKESAETSFSNVDTIILIIGSERGLCGKFNASLLEKGLQFIDQNQFSSHQIWVMGSRLLLEFERKGVSIAWRKALPASGLTTYQEAYILTQDWLEQYESFAFNQFIILFNQVAKGGTHQFVQKNLLPFEIQQITTQQPASNQQWPPAIVETDPMGMYRQIIQHFFTSSFFQALLLSAAAEHSARYHLMQEASENAQEIIEDMVQVLNAERKRKITQQMQELAVSAGLLEN
jgi:F-type H+-transporting ATPase subunit gamma